MELIKATFSTLGFVFKRVFDILSTYLLFWVLWFATVAAALHYGMIWGFAHLGIEKPELLWQVSSQKWGISVDILRLAFFLSVQALLFVLLRRPFAWLQPYAEKIFEWFAHIFFTLSRERPVFRLVGEVAFSLVVSAMLVPFVLQPTLVRGHNADAWLIRSANLLDGTASVTLVDSVIGFYHRLYASPVVNEGVSPREVDQAIDYLEAVEDNEERMIAGTPNADPVMVIEQRAPSGNAMMDRWDDEISRAVADQPELFSYLKAFMYVESAGRQYAVSRTGCSGLMQFCAGTARTEPYRSVFCRGQGYVCKCDGQCRIPRDVQRSLESGNVDVVKGEASKFPCELTDARFDPDKAIKAGKLYIQRLHRKYDGNIYLMYIGYNSGPGVSNRIWGAVGQNGEASLEEIAAHLPSALQPYYGKGAERRARSLVRVHLPKIARAEASARQALDAKEMAGAQTFEYEVESARTRLAVTTEF